MSWPLPLSPSAGIGSMLTTEVVTAKVEKLAASRDPGSALLHSNAARDFLLQVQARLLPPAVQILVGGFLPSLISSC